MDIFIQTSEYVFAAGSTINIFSVTIGAILHRFTGGEKLAEVWNWNRIFIGVRDALTTVLVKTQLPTLVQGGDMGQGVN